MKPFNSESFLILVVDDVNKNLQLVIAILERAGYATTFATNGFQAIERAIAAHPDLILLDLMMPGMSGLETCEKIKSIPDFEGVPIIFLTASDSKDHLLQAFDQGAVDYITKPCRAPELLARVKIHLQLKQTQDELKMAYLEMEKLATMDELTEVANRRSILATFRDEFLRSQRYAREFSILMIDIDYFKRFNDDYGHDTGDEVLKSISATVGLCLRQVDYFGRLGGEEFLVVLPETPRDKAEITAQRIRETVASISWQFDERVLKSTLSIGGTTFHPQDADIQALLKRADRALFVAKKERNQVWFL